MCRSRRPKGEAIGHSVMSDSDDDAPPVVSLSSARDAALQQEAAEKGSARKKSAKKVEKEVSAKQRGVVHAQLRDAEHFPAELLSQLPPVAPEQAKGAAAASRSRKRKGSDVAGPKGDAVRRPAAPVGMPDVLLTENNVTFAVLPGANDQRSGRAPLRAATQTFVQKALYGKGTKRMSASTLASLKPAAGRNGPRFAAACNFSTATATPAVLRKSKSARRRKKRAQLVGATPGAAAAAGPPTALDRMAAKIMSRNKK